VKLVRDDTIVVLPTGIFIVPAHGLSFQREPCRVIVFPRDGAKT